MPAGSVPPIGGTVLQAAALHPPAPIGVGGTSRCITQMCFPMGNFGVWGNLEHGNWLPVGTWRIGMGAGGAWENNRSMGSLALLWVWGKWQSYHAGCCVSLLPDGQTHGEAARIEIYGNNK